MTAYDKLKAARQNGRPTGKAYVEGLFDNRVLLHGDRRFAEDSAIVSGVGYLDGKPVTFIAIDRGTDMASRMKNHFGCAKPEGYRKALRLMKQAEKFRRPVVCIVDTLGAYPGADGEERGQGQAVAENIMEMMGLKTPVISIVVGEGGSGGALALAASDKVYMLENAVYSVITPEGCASILWKDAGRVADAAACLHITAHDMVNFHVAERVIDEDFDNFAAMCERIKQQLKADFKELSSLSTEQMLAKRYGRFRRIGVYKEKGELVGQVTVHE
jgi:acetyl-CoA carboxylase carboxyl transferase alpha subunit